jgi:hypothetical protein
MNTRIDFRALLGFMMIGVLACSVAASGAGDVTIDTNRAAEIDRILNIYLDPSNKWERAMLQPLTTSIGVTNPVPSDISNLLQARRQALDVIGSTPFNSPEQTAAVQTLRFIMNKLNTAVTEEQHRYQLTHSWIGPEGCPGYAHLTEEIARLLIERSKTTK